jgi:hypothetical protein
MGCSALVGAIALVLMKDKSAKKSDEIDDE